MSIIKKKNKTILIIILLIIAVILAIILCIWHIFDVLKYNGYISEISIDLKSDIKQNPNNYTLEEILDAFECKNINYIIKKDIDDNSFFEIKLVFKNNLYENSISQKEYFDSIVKTLSKKLKLPFKIIDESKNIEIYVDNKKDIYTINGIEDYFNNNSYMEVENRKVISTKEFYRSNNILNSIITNGWSRDGLSLESEPKSISEEWIDYGNYKLNYTDININYIVFLKEFESKVIEEIKVGDSFEKIKKKLGDPDFNNKNMIGYKTIDGYAFFYKDKIIIYPCIELQNNSLENKIVNYCEGSYNGYRTNLVIDILKNYKDFKSEFIQNGVKLFSFLRGIDLYLYDDNTVNIVVYNNYKFSSALENYAKCGKLELKFNEDSIYNYERNRNSN